MFHTVKYEDNKKTQNVNLLVIQRYSRITSHLVEILERFVKIKTNTR